MLCYLKIKIQVLHINQFNHHLLSPEVNLKLVASLFITALTASLPRFSSTYKAFKHTIVFFTLLCYPPNTTFFNSLTSPFKNTSFSFSFKRKLGLEIVSL